MHIILYIDWDENEIHSLCVLLSELFCIVVRSGCVCMLVSHWLAHCRRFALRSCDGYCWNWDIVDAKAFRPPSPVYTVTPISTGSVVWRLAPLAASHRLSCFHVETCPDNSYAYAVNFTQSPFNVLFRFLWTTYVRLNTYSLAHQICIDLQTNAQLTPVTEAFTKSCSFRK